jgi:ABC-type transporter Mla subunit MlaD
MFLEEQTDDIAHTIQDLLQTMRSASSSGPELKHFIRKVNDRIDAVVEESRLTFSKHGDSELVMDANDLSDTLSRARSTMDGLVEDIMADSSNKSVKQKIANTSYDIAKTVKEHQGLLE